MPNPRLLLALLALTLAALFAPQSASAKTQLNTENRVRAFSAETTQSALGKADLTPDRLYEKLASLRRLASGSPLAAKGGAGLRGNPLFKDALSPYKGGSLSSAGRALTKHPGVVGSSKATLRTGLRTDAAINQAAAGQLKNIMRNGVRTTPNLPRYGDVVQYQLPGGFGARWTEAGKFIGFISP